MKRNHSRHSTIRRIHENRAGSAPIEFVMALPVLLSMFALIMTLGVVSMSRLNVDIMSRRDAWKERTSHTSQRPMAYISQTSQGDVYSVDATETPDYPSKFNYGSVTTSHAVLGGSWDYRELLKGNGPHWEDMAKASVDGETNQIAGLLDQFSNLFSASNIPALASMLGGDVGDFLSAAEDALSALGEGTQQMEALTRGEVDRLNGEITKLGNEKSGIQKQLDDTLIPKRDGIQRDIDDLKTKIGNEKNPEKKKGLEKDLKTSEEDLDKVNGDIKTKEDRIGAIDRQVDATKGIVDRL